jgi:hypothetical protein
MANARSLGWLAVKFLPVIPLALLVGWQAARVDPYPRQIKVTQPSCSAPENNGRLTYREKTYCVTALEAQEWHSIWRTEYALIAAFGLCFGASTIARRALRPVS